METFYTDIATLGMRSPRSGSGSFIRCFVKRHFLFGMTVALVLAAFALVLARTSRAATHEAVGQRAVGLEAPAYAATTEMAPANAAAPSHADSSYADSLSANDNTNFVIPDNGGDLGDCSCALTVIKGLNFGAMFTTASAGTIVIDPASEASYTGGVFAHTGVHGYTPCAAEVELNLVDPTHCESDDHCQNDNDEYQRNEDDDDRSCDTRNTFERHGLDCALSISNSTTLRRTGGTETMTADTYTHSRTKGDITIGATLHVHANQKSGNYSGTFYVTLDYE